MSLFSLSSSWNPGEDARARTMALLLTGVSLAVMLAAGRLGRSGR